MIDLQLLHWVRGKEADFASDDVVRPWKMTIKILLIEDHPVSRTGIKFLLSGVADFEVVGEGENGVQAVELARTLQPDVVLMDVAMPMMNGIDAARALLQENSGRAKVIMLTAYDSEQDIYASLTAGAHGYCLKDTDAERLCGAIRSVASGDIWLDAGIADKFLQGLKSAILRSPPQLMPPRRIPARKALHSCLRVRAKF